MDSGAPRLPGRGVNQAATNRPTPPTIPTNNTSELNASKTNQINEDDDDDIYVAGEKLS